MFDTGLLLLAGMAMLSGVYLLMKVGVAPTHDVQNRRQRLAVIPIQLGVIFTMLQLGASDQFYEIISLILAALTLAVIVWTLNSAIARQSQEAK